MADLDSFFEAAREKETPWRFARVLRPPVRRNIKLAEGPSFGQTIFEYAPTSAGAEDYATLADVLMREWDAMLAKRDAEIGPSPEVHVLATAPHTPVGT